MHKTTVGLVVLTALLWMGGCNHNQSAQATQGQTTPAAAPTPKVSGMIVTGYRVLPVDWQADTLRYTVYRGDYIKFDLGKGHAPVTVIFPALKESLAVSMPYERAPYIKMKKPGRFAFSLAGKPGFVNVIRFSQPHYSLVQPREAQALLENVHPFLLDVRTPGEYQRGHIAGATLIPLQELQRRLGELSAYKNQDILVYCASGNRSTVASKILIDAGFKRIYNLATGIHGWVRAGLPLER